MRKSSKQARQHYHQSGIGGGGSVVYRMPRSAGWMPPAFDLSKKAQTRLKAVVCAKRFGVVHAAEVFRVSRASIYRWLMRLNPHDLRSLEERSRRPHHNIGHLLLYRCFCLDGQIDSGEELL